MAEITLAIQGNGAVPYPVPDGTTVDELRELIDINPTLEIRIGGQPATGAQVVNEGDLVVATQPVKGGV